MERVRYDLFVGINTQTFYVICNSAVGAVVVMILQSGVNLCMYQ